MGGGLSVRTFTDICISRCGGNSSNASAMVEAESVGSKPVKSCESIGSEEAVDYASEKYETMAEVMECMELLNKRKQLVMEGMAACTGGDEKSKGLDALRLIESEFEAIKLDAREIVGAMKQAQDVASSRKTRKISVVSWFFDFSTEPERSVFTLDYTKLELAVFTLGSSCG